MIPIWLAVVIAVPVIAYLCLICYGLGLRSGRREGIAECSQWRQPQ